jgi:hypothetical protein
MIRSRWSAALVAMVLGVVLPGLSQACPMCFAGSERTRIAIFRMTIMMSLLPLGMIGTGLLWLRRGGRHFLADEFEDRDAYSPLPPSPDARTATTGAKGSTPETEPISGVTW